MLFIANLENKICFTESINQTLMVIQFTIHTRLKEIQFDLYQNGKVRNELTDKVKDKESDMLHWKTSNVSVQATHIPIHVGRLEKKEVIDHIVIARKRKIPCCSSHKSSMWGPVKMVSRKIRYRYKFFVKKISKIAGTKT